MPAKSDNMFFVIKFLKKQVPSPILRHNVACVDCGQLTETLSGIITFRNKF